MNRLFTDLVRPALFTLNAEAAHRWTLQAVRLGAGLVGDRQPRPRLTRHLWDLEFANPLGMAAGFDKNGEAVDPVLALGFGFAEVGTVTPMPQPGNPKPRLFRLPEDRAVINRYGFNNLGHAALAKRLRSRRGRPGVVGVNIGANKDAADRVADYVEGVRAFASLASYFTVNVSSPNTPGLRDLQAREALAVLLGAVIDERDRLAVLEGGRQVPVLLKIAPDITRQGLEDIADVALAIPVDGCIVCNTTISREGLRSPARSEAGGLSGRPVFRLSTIQLARLRQLTAGRIPLIGAGGIESGATAWQKITAGADLIQLYTGLVYEGPGLVTRILNRLEAELDRRGLSEISEAVGIETDTWAAKSV